MNHGGVAQEGHRDGMIGGVGIESSPRHQWGGSSVGRALGISTQEVVGSIPARPSICRTSSPGRASVVSWRKVRGSTPRCGAISQRIENRRAFSRVSGQPLAPQIAGVVEHHKDCCLGWRAF